jgi:hypothetical protein
VAVEDPSASDDARPLADALGVNVVGVPVGADGVRVDAGYRAGDTVTPFYDPMIAKVIAHAATREEARTNLLLSGAFNAIDIDGDNVAAVDPQVSVPHPICTTLVDLHRVHRFIRIIRRNVRYALACREIPNRNL